MKRFRCQVVKPTPGEREVTQDSKAAEECRLPRLTGPPLFVGPVLGADAGPWSSIPAVAKNVVFSRAKLVTTSSQMGNAVSPAHHTYAVVGVELRRHKPFIGSIRN